MGHPTRNCIKGRRLQNLGPAASSVEPGGHFARRLVLQKHPTHRVRPILAKCGRRVPTASEVLSGTI
jgi:hypothetical protein